MSETKTVELAARYDRDTKRTHRFLLEAAEGIAGSIYIDKDAHSLPKQIILNIKVKEDQ